MTCCGSSVDAFHVPGRIDGDRGLVRQAVAAEVTPCPLPRLFYRSSPRG